MAVNFANNYKSILDKLESIIESEFRGALPVYKGSAIPKGVNQAIQLIPEGSELLEYQVTAELREFEISVRFVFNEANVNETALDHILRQVSRIEALIHDNVAMTLSDNSNAFNCRFESTDLNAEPDSGIYVVLWDYRCQHLGNVA
jgi:hypothetical protein